MHIQVAHRVHVCQSRCRQCTGHLAPTTPINGSRDKERQQGSDQHNMLLLTLHTHVCHVSYAPSRTFHTSSSSPTTSASRVVRHAITSGPAQQRTSCAVEWSPMPDSIFPRLSSHVSDACSGADEKISGSG